MKKNLFLFLILILLVVFTYFYQEVGLWNHVPKSLTASLNIDEIDTLYFKDGSISLKPEPKIDNTRFPADLKAVKRFLTALSFIRVEKELSYQAEQYNQYFSPDAKKVKFRRSNLLEIEFILGFQVPGEEHFYWLERKGDLTKLYIASFEEVLNNGETQYLEEGDKYRHLEQLINIESDIFFLADIFKESEKKIIESISVWDTENAKALYTLPWKPNANLKLAHSLTWNQDKISLCQNELLNLKAESIIDSNFELVKHLKLRSQIHFQFENNFVRKLKLYQDQNVLNFFFLQIDEAKFFYKISLGKENCFLMSEQDYWKKSLPMDKTALLFLIEKNDKMELKKDKETSPLFDLLQSRDPFNEADRISKLSSRDPISLLKGLNLKWGSLNLFLAQKKDEILLLNKNEGIILHYYLTPKRLEAKLSLDPKDYRP